MGLTRTDELCKDAVRIALTNGLTRKQVADDLGVGMLTLNKWITAHRDTDVVSKEDLGLAQENDRLRRENRILKTDTPRAAAILLCEGGYSPFPRLHAGIAIVSRTNGVPMPIIRSSCSCCWTHLFSVESPTPKSDES